MISSCARDSGKLRRRWDSDEMMHRKDILSVSDARNKAVHQEHGSNYWVWPLRHLPPSRCCSYDHSILLINCSISSSKLTLFDR